MSTEPSRSGDRRSSPHRLSRWPPGIVRGRILVVEDNALNQLVAEGILTKLGYQVDIVANGVEALVAVDAVPAIWRC